MNSRIVQHIGFWTVYLLIITLSKFLFPSSSDGEFTQGQLFLRLLAMEAIFLPWKMIPFYYLFYIIIPNKKNTNDLLSVFQMLMVFIFCIFCFRSLIAPVADHFYGDKIDFNVYTFKRMLYTFLEILPGFALASAIKLFKNKKASEENEKLLLAQKQILEIQLLKSQFNPHFLFNTLNNLYGLVRKNKINSGEYILKLAGIMRYIIEECKAPKVSLEAEVQLIEDFIALESLRYDERLEVKFEKDVKIPQTISPLILITFVENAFKHGASELSDNSFVHIHLIADVKTIEFTVVNDSNKTTTGFGNGIANAEKQLQLIYADNYQLKINHMENIFSVHLILHI